MTSEEQNHQDWLELLAGHTVSGADPDIVREAQIFREALLWHSTRLTAAVSVSGSQILTKVLTQLENEGLLAPLPPPKPSRFKQWLAGLSKPQPHYYPNPRLAFAATVLLMAIVLTPFLYHSVFTPEQEPLSIAESGQMVSKGVLPCRNDIISPQPQVTANQLKEELQAVGVEATIKQVTADKWRLKATLPTVRPSELKNTLKNIAKDYQINEGVQIPQDYLCFTILSTPRK